MCLLDRGSRDRPSDREGEGVKFAYADEMAALQWHNCRSVSRRLLLQKTSLLFRAAEQQASEEEQGVMVDVQNRGSAGLFKGIC